MKIIFIGDVFGKPGRDVLKRHLPQLIENYNPNFIIANVENVAGGKGITEKTAKEIFEMPIDAGTGGNHIWEQKDHKTVFEKFPVVRPLNIKDQKHGKGFLILEKDNLSLVIISIHGQAFINNAGAEITNPFHEMDNLLKNKKLPACVVVDFHAEATAEKKAMLWYLNGRVSALIGTHTHVQTADEFVTEEGTAYITDVGMAGPHKSVVGMRTDRALARFLNNDGKSLIVSKEGLELNAVLIDVDEKTGKAILIERIRSHG